jgi:hypothetical protein
VSRADLDLKLVALAALEGLVVATAVDQTAARVVPAILLALVAPGYALSVALLPESRDGFERCLLALGLSLCVIVLGGLILDLTPWGLTSRSWGISLAAFTLAACALAKRRRSAVAPAATPDEKSQESSPPAPRRRVPTKASIGVAAVAAMVLGAVLIARLPSSSAHVRGFTALWAVPVSETNSSFSIGIRSDELRTTSYRVVARAGPSVVFRRHVTLRPGGQWLAEGRFAGALPAGTGKELRVSLYKDDRPTVVYRRVYLTFGGTGF